MTLSFPTRRSPVLRAHPIGVDREPDHSGGGIVDPFRQRSGRVQGVGVAERLAQLVPGGDVLRLSDDLGLGSLKAAAQGQGGGQGEGSGGEAHGRLREGRSLPAYSNPRARHPPRASCRIIADAFSAIMMVGALVLPVVSTGITEASTTRSPCRPRSRSRESTTAAGSSPIRQVPTGW